MKYFLQISFIFLLLASLSINVCSQNNELDKIQTTYQKFLDNKKGNAEQKKIAYETAKEFVFTMTDIDSVVVDYLKLWIDKYELSQKINFDVTDWQRFKRCGITFLAPSTLKDLGGKGIEACVASLENEDISLNLSYGWNVQKILYNKSFINFNEEEFEIDGKKALFTTYAVSNEDSLKDNKKYVAGAYVYFRNMTSFNIKLSGKTEEDMEIAKLIFSLIKFDK